MTRVERREMAAEACKFAERGDIDGYNEALLRCLVLAGALTERGARIAREVLGVVPSACWEDDIRTPETLLEAIAEAKHRATHLRAERAHAEDSA